MQAYGELAVIYSGDNMLLFFNSIGTRVSKPFEPWISHCELVGITYVCGVELTHWHLYLLLQCHWINSVHALLMAGYCICEFEEINSVVTESS